MFGLNKQKEPPKPHPYSNALEEVLQEIAQKGESISGKKYELHADMTYWPFFLTILHIFSDTLSEMKKVKDNG